MSVPPNAGTIGEYAQFLAPAVWKRTRCPGWPPDVFALTAALLQRSGAYVHIVSIGGSQPYDESWPVTARKLAAAWDAAINRDVARGGDPIAAAAGIGAPAKLDRWWRRLHKAAHRPLSDINSDTHLRVAIVSLMAVADEASAGFGVPSEPGVDDPLTASVVHLVLWTNDFLSVCAEVSTDKARVLPKQHTSQRGIALRSLSHNLALNLDVEVRAEWHLWHSPAPLHALNVLVLPWPQHIDPKCFALVPPAADALALPPPYRYFTYSRGPGSPATIVAAFERALREAAKVVDCVHAVVFPETALTLREYRAIERVALKRRILLVSGVENYRPHRTRAQPQNVAIVQPAGLMFPENPHVLAADMRMIQPKNHRWCLDRSQIQRYGLSGILPASKDCWELTELGERAVTFHTIDPWLTFCVLICEDLARQDAISDVVRSVGPSLVIALLMDGPQLRSRWPSRYASILSDDPGSSVLTLTSLGMNRMSTPDRDSTPRGDVIALWRDINTGETEIELRAEQNACVLSLVCDSEQEFTADGRDDGGVAHFPVLSGIHRLKV